MMDSQSEFMQNKKNLQSEIVTLKNQLKNSTMDTETREDLSEELQSKQEDLEALIEDRQFEQEDLKERAETHLWDFGREGQYHPYFKKPTKKQMQEVLSALDEQFPNWEEKGDEPLLATLQSNFPELVKKPLPSQQKSGCLGLLVVLVGFPVLFVILSTAIA